MAWVLLLTVLVLGFIARSRARRRRVFTGSGPVSTMSMSKKHAKKKKAALDAATAVLR